MKTRVTQTILFFAVLFLCFAPRCNATAATKAEILQALRQTISVEFDETPLDEVANYLRQALDVNIVLDTEDTQPEFQFINLRLQNVPASSVLNWVTQLSHLDYTVTDHAIYIAPRNRVANKGPVYFRQYDVTDLLVPLEGALSNNNNDDDDDDNENDDDDDDNNNSRADAQRELMDLILIFTGGSSNWDDFGIIGGDENDTEDDRISEEDTF